MWAQRLLLGGLLLSAAAPGVACAEDGARPAKHAHGRKARPPRPRKKQARARPARGIADKAPAATEADTSGSHKAHDKGGKTRARAETHAPAVAVESGSSQSTAALAAQQSAAGARAQIVREGDTNVKVMEFTGLGIEGRLKSPQLLYFVQRVRAEFDRPVLAHRSFMPELQASTQREPVR